MTQRVAIRKGQRYVQSISTMGQPTVWQVGAIESRAVPIPHARLVCVDDPLTVKTISCTTLGNSSYYRLLADAVHNSA